MSTAKLNSENDDGAANHIDSTFGSTSHTAKLISDILREDEESRVTPDHIVDPPQGEIALTTSHTSDDPTNQKTVWAINYINDPHHAAHGEAPTITEHLSNEEYPAVGTQQSEPYTINHLVSPCHVSTHPCVP